MRLRILALIVVLQSCNSYLFDQVCPESVEEGSVTVAAGVPTPADILFVVDNSGSMEDEQENLAANFGRFIDQIAGTGDYRIAVVTTDQDSGVEQDGQAVSIFNGGQYQDLDRINRGGCQDTSPPHRPRLFSRSQPQLEANRLGQSGCPRPNSAFQQNVRVGSCGSGNEVGLKAIDVRAKQDWIRSMQRGLPSRQCQPGGDHRVR